MTERAGRTVKPATVTHRHTIKPTEHTGGTFVDCGLGGVHDVDISPLAVKDVLKLTVRKAVYMTGKKAEHAQYCPVTL